MILRPYQTDAAESRYLAALVHQLAQTGARAVVRSLSNALVVVSVVVPQGDRITRLRVGESVHRVEPLLPSMTITAVVSVAPADAETLWERP